MGVYILFESQGERGGSSVFLWTAFSSNLITELKLADKIIAFPSS